MGEITPLYLDTSAAFKLILSYANTFSKTILISADFSLIQLAGEYKMKVFNPEVEL